MLQADCRQEDVLPNWQSQALTSMSKHQEALQKAGSWEMQLEALKLVSLHDVPHCMKQ